MRRNRLHPSSGSIRLEKIHICHFTVLNPRSLRINVYRHENNQILAPLQLRPAISQYNVEIRVNYSRMSHNEMASIKFIASQERTVFQYKNTRTKIPKCCANIYFNKQCPIKKFIPGYANIKLPNTSPAARITQKK